MYALCNLQIVHYHKEENMSNSKFNWDEIMADCADIIARSISSGKKIPSTLPELYKLLSERYSDEGKKLPVQNTFRQIMHGKLNIGHNQKNVQSAFYRLAGKYDKMTLQMLSDNIVISTDTVADAAAWLFIRLKNKKIPANEKNAHLYYLSHKMKEKFDREIIFISFDTDTLVIMCTGNDSRKKILSYFSNTLKNIADITEQEVI